MKATEEKNQKGKQPQVQDKPDAKRVKTVTPDNDNGNPGPPAAKQSSNKSPKG